jgi:hypothetical protein
MAKVTTSVRVSHVLNVVFVKGQYYKLKKNRKNKVFLFDQIINPID